MNLTKKLILLFIAIGLLPFVIIGIYSFESSKHALEDAAFRRLIGFRELKSQTLDDYFELIRQQTITMAQDRMVITAMEDFSTAYNLVESQLGKAYDADLKKNEDGLKERYLHQQKNTKGAPGNAVSLWWPSDKTARILQHYYISGNPFPIEKKYELVDTKDGSVYNALHLKYHPIFKDFVMKFGYYDMFLVEPKGGAVVYTVYKEIDFTTNLKTGPFSNGGSAKAFNAALNLPKGSARLVDFSSYYPSYGRAASFIAAPIYDGEHLVGVLMFQMPLGKINDMMTNYRQWKAIGSGNTGESYIVGDDLIMRSDSRYVSENIDGLASQLASIGVPMDTINTIKSDKTTVGVLRFDSDVVRKALAGISGDKVYTKDYRGANVLMVYKKQNIKDVNWAVFTQIEEDEAFKDAVRLRNAAILVGLILLAIIVLSSIAFARSIGRPINMIVTNLSSSSSQIAATITEQERIASIQSSSVTQTSTTIDELSASTRQSSEQAQSSSEGANRAYELASSGSVTMSNVKENMSEMRKKVSSIADHILNLSEQTAQIANITNLVSDFANETKMLAMNAAVEAVRAGEYGKGFSVVAMEIRKLADQSKSSTEHINNLVSEIQKSTNSTVMVTEEGARSVETVVKLVQNSEEIFDEIVTATNNSMQSSQQISLNIKQQAAAMKQIVSAMTALTTGAKETASGIAQTRQGIQTIDNSAKSLKAIV